MPTLSHVGNNTFFSEAQSSALKSQRFQGLYKDAREKGLPHSSLAACAERSSTYKIIG